MEFLKKLKKEILGHEEVELADILQAVLLALFIALLLFIVLKLKMVI